MTGSAGLDTNALAEVLADHVGCDSWAVPVPSDEDPGARGLGYACGIMVPPPIRGVARADRMHVALAIVAAQPPQDDLALDHPRCPCEGCSADYRHYDRAPGTTSGTSQDDRGPGCTCTAYTIRTDYGTGVEHDVDPSGCPVHEPPQDDQVRESDRAGLVTLTDVLDAHIGVSWVIRLPRAGWYCTCGREFVPLPVATGVNGLTASVPDHVLAMHRAHLANAVLAAGFTRHPDDERETLAFDGRCPTCVQYVHGPRADCKRPVCACRPTRHPDTGLRERVEAVGASIGHYNAAQRALAGRVPHTEVGRILSDLRDAVNADYRAALAEPTPGSES